MKLTQLRDRLDTELRIDAFVDIDGSPNGLQVGGEGTTIDRAAFAVDAAAATIEEAVAWEADLLAVHHGLWWEGTERLTGRTYDRVAALVANDLALYVAHLPLDGHQALGNAAGIANVLDLDGREPFGAHEGEPIGQRGRLPSPAALSDLVDALDAAMVSEDRPQTLAFGPETVEDVAIVTGSGVDWLGEAVEVGADVLITGEGKHAVYHTAREAGMNVILGGHYATETFGVRALQDLVEGWGVETRFIDHPTGL